MVNSYLEVKSLMMHHMQLLKKQTL